MSCAFGLLSGRQMGLVREVNEWISNKQAKLWIFGILGFWNLGFWGFGLDHVCLE